MSGSTDSDGGPSKRPPTLGSSIALSAGIVSLLSLALSSVEAFALGVLGLGLLAGGLYAPARRLVTIAGGVLLLALLVAGVRGAGPEAMLIAALGAVIGWDLAEFSIGVGEQLRSEADTSRLVTVHAATSLLVGVAGTVVVYGVYLASGGGRPASAVVFLLVGVVVLVAVLRRRPTS